MSTLTTMKAPHAQHAQHALPDLPAPMRSIPEVLAEVAAAHADDVAVSSPGRQLTYGEIAVGSRALAARLLGALPAGTSPDAPIALLATASPSSVLATMAIVSTGHPFVVLDTQLPLGRLQQVQDVAGAVLCLAEAELAGRVSGLDGLIVLELEEEVAALEGVTDDVELPPVSPTAAASIVFTSGSTGVPKGVIHSHRFLVAQAEGAARQFHSSTEYRVGALTSAAFVAGTAVIFIVLLNGGSLHLYDPRERGIAGLPEWLRTERVSAISLTPSLLRSIVKMPSVGTGLPDLRMVGLGGEAVLGTDVLAVWTVLGPCAVHVGYGSSETMQVTADLLVPGRHLPPGRLPAGRRMGAKTFEVVDEEGRPVPVGTTGMLQVTGPAHLLADGYLNAPPELSRLFSTHDDGTRSFLLRDLVRLDADGVLHVVGRADDAVKVRGYLVEPAEIEDALRALDDVTEAVVIAVQAGATTSLVAYAAVAGASRPPSPRALRMALRSTLPDWMVPAEVVLLETLPRNERGKVDRGALPRPVRPAHEAPANAAEKVVAELWSTILGRDDVGRRDTFLALGGDSLAVEELVTRLHRDHAVALTTADIIENPTVAELAQLLPGSSASSSPGSTSPARGAVGRIAALGSAWRSRAEHPPEVVTLRSTGEGQPVLCVSGAGGSGRAFWPLAEALGSDRPVYALQPHGMEGAAVPSFTIAMAARRYLRAILRVQPTGPYLLAGHSMGGLIAIDIARRLAATGQEVLPIVLLDAAAPPRALGASFSEAVTAMVRHDGDLAAAGAGAGAVVGAVPVPAPAWPPTAGSRRSVLRIAKGSAEQARSLALASTNRVPLAAQEGTFFWFGARVSMLHRPRPFTGDAVLLQTDENPQSPSAWSEVLKGEVVTHHVSGDHNSMLRPPYVAAVAAHISALTPR